MTTTKPKKMTKKERLAQERYTAALGRVRRFVENEKSLGVYVNVQFSLERSLQSAFLGTMPIPLALGAMEAHRETILSGLRHSQVFDQYVQQVEGQPDLMKRLLAAAGCEPKAEKRK